MEINAKNCDSKELFDHFFRVDSAPKKVIPNYDTFENGFPLLSINIIVLFKNKCNISLLIKIRTYGNER